MGKELGLKDLCIPSSPIKEEGKLDSLIGICLV